MDHKQGNQSRNRAPRGRFCTWPSNWLTAPGDGMLRWQQVTACHRNRRGSGPSAGAILEPGRHFAMGDEVHTVSCYEAGRDGFLAARYLHNCGIDNVVVDSAQPGSGPAVAEDENRPGRCGKLLRMLVRYQGGRSTSGGWCGCRAGRMRTPGIYTGIGDLEEGANQVPQPDSWDFDQQGLRIDNPSKKKFVKELEFLRTWDGLECRPR